MRIRIVYRSSGRDNAKARPPFYSKALALASFLRAVESSPEASTVVFLNDAPVAADNAAVMHEWGEVVDRTDLTLVRSYREAVSLPVRRGWAPTDVVYLCEDDYLFCPEAFSSLALVAREVPGRCYFAFYATLRADAGTPTGDGGEGRLLADGRRWERADSTTSSFGAHLSTLRGDRWLHLVGSRAGADFDRAICESYGGTAPYRWRVVARQAMDRTTGGPRARAVRAASQAVLNAAALEAQRRPRPILAPAPALATHMELPHLASGVDWEQAAAEARSWGSARSPALARALERA